METIDALRPEKNLKTEIEKIWEGYYKDATHYYSPLVPEWIQTNTTLFLSLNPSIAKDSKPNSFTLETYPLDTKMHPHYRKFVEITNNAKLEGWTFLDLLFVRNGQTEIERIKRNNPEFIIEQARLTIQIIKKIRPRLVIVCNSLADRILHTYGKEIEFIPILEDDVYHLDKIPFIIKQSEFLGNPRIKWASKNPKIIEKRTSLLREIERVLKQTENWFSQNH